jgi:hypothetical protein
LIEFTIYREISMDAYFFIGLFVIFFIIPCITASIAGNKGRSRTAWFLSAFFLGPLVLLIAIIIPSLNYYPENKGMTQEQEAAWKEYGYELLNRNIEERIAQNKW